MADYFTGYQNALPQTSLADMMNLANTAQQYKQAQAMNPLTLQAKQLEIQQTQALNPIARQKAAEDLRQLLATNPDIAARIASESRQAGTAADVAAAVAPSTISSAQSAAQTAAAGARAADLETSLKFAKQGTNRAYQLLDDPNLTRQKVVDSVTAHLQNMPNVKPGDIKIAVDSIPKAEGDALKPALIDFIRANNEGMLSSLTNKYAPSTLTDIGGTQVPVSLANKTLTNVAPGTVTGAALTKTIPPGQPFVDASGAKFIPGPNGQRQYTDIGPAATAAQTALGTSSGTDWGATVEAANAATNTRSIYDKIRAALPLAFTGVGSDKKQFLSKVAQAIGVSVNTLETTNTEELVKNSKLLQVVGGNTDAARSIAELANPSANMTLAGNQKIIEQLDGQEKFKEQKANFLEPVAGDPTAYQQRLRQWNAAADPLFYTQMSQEDAAQMMGTMSAARKAELMQKRDRAKALGILQ
jgi:hypothetical protein